MLSALGKVSAWATEQGYDLAAVNTFFQVADYYLVAFAVAHKHTIVTHKVASPSTKKIKIPNACIGLEVKCVTPYEMLRGERARFILGPSGGSAWCRVNIRHPVDIGVAHGERLTIKDLC
jgi:hypothetical protein